MRRFVFVAPFQNPKVDCGGFYQTEHVVLVPLTRGSPIDFADVELTTQDKKGHVKRFLHGGKEHTPKLTDRLLCRQRCLRPSRSGPT